MFALLQIQIYHTKRKDNPNKFSAFKITEYLCDKESAFELWFLYYQEKGFHVDVTNMAGMPMDFSGGINNVSYG